MGRRSRAGSATGLFGAYRIEGIAVLAALLMGVAFFAFSSPARGTPQHLSDFSARYDVGGTKLDSCATCHTDPSAPKTGNLNPYGTDFANNNHDFAVIEPNDSDGDGHTNIDEINAATFPGDPADYPGAAPPEPPPPPPTTTTTTTKPSPLPIPVPGLQK